MSADRRTLVVAAVAMVVLVAVGVVSAALFTGSACDDLRPEPTSPGAAGDDVDAVVAEALGDLPTEEVARLVDDLAAVGGDGATVVAAADVGAASGLTTLAGDLAAVGETAVVFDGPGQARAAATLPADATVVGDGGAVYALALVNELTGQVDGLVPVGPGLEGATCTDTANVGAALAFALDAGDGQLLLLRSDDEAEHTELEVREAGGEHWRVPVELGAGPPGALAEELTGHLGDELVVTARRSAADDVAPALVARERAGGDERWVLTPDDLDRLAPRGDEDMVPEVVGVADGTVLVALSREDRDAVLLVGLSASSGEPRWTSDRELAATPSLVGSLADQPLLLTTRDDGGEDGALREAVRIDPADGATTSVHGLEGSPARAVGGGSRALLAVGDEVAHLAAAGEVREAELPVAAADVVDTPEGAALLLRGDEGAAVVWLAW